jgi:hypothetical protein
MTLTTKNIAPQLSLYITRSTDKRTEVVKNMTFEVSAYEVRGSVHVPDYAAEALSSQSNQYALASLLHAFGEPESVLVSTSALPPDGKEMQDIFEVILTYPDFGILAKYTTERLQVRAFARGCPDRAHIKLILFPEGMRPEFQEYLRDESSAHFGHDRFRGLEEVTELSREEFFRLFLESTGACLDTPSSIWPVPGYQ